MQNTNIIATYSIDNTLKIFNSLDGTILNSISVTSSRISDLLGIAWTQNGTHIVYPSIGEIPLSVPAFPNLITNGTFASGALSPWTTSAAPTAADLVTRVQSQVSVNHGLLL